tara:strand:+ start:80 stop:1426 length:1347 start_codon:yes stop_codon:yes gene_type:complete
MSKNLLLIELNECDFEFFLYGSKKYNYPLIKKFFSKKKKIDTFTKDKEEGFNLDPWVQWVSVHTGKLSQNHKVFRLGQKLDPNIDQIWDKLSKKNITSSIWGAFNANLRKNKNINLFFPDPWSFKENAFPKNLNAYLKLPRYYAQNYPNVKKLKTISLGIIFLINFIFTQNLIFLCKKIPDFFKIFYTSKLKSFNLYFLLDLFSLIILKNNLKKKKSDLVIIGINSFAHYQHNYWNNKQYEKVYFWYLNEMLKIINNISKLYTSSIIFNGFSQKKIKNEFYLRPKEPKNFLDKLNLSYLSTEPNMTTGAIVKFKTFKEKNIAIKKIRSLKIYNYNIFEVENFKNEKKIFYKFSLVSLKKEYDERSLEKKNYKLFFKKPLKSTKNKILSKKNKIDIDKILRDTIFMKSSSKHVTKGKLFYSNFNFLKKSIIKNKIHNIDIYKTILNHFN